MTGQYETEANVPKEVRTMTMPTQGQEHSRLIRHAGGFHYGWIIVAILVVVQVIGSAIS